jgi:hypothetical protein
MSHIKGDSANNVDSLIPRTNNCCVGNRASPILNLARPGDSHGQRLNMLSASGNREEKALRRKERLWLHVTTQQTSYRTIPERFPGRDVPHQTRRAISVTERQTWEVDSEGQRNGRTKVDRCPADARRQFDPEILRNKRPGKAIKCTH